MGSTILNAKKFGRNVFWHCYCSEIKSNTPYQVIFCLACLFFLILMPMMGLAGELNQISEGVSDAYNTIYYYGISLASMFLFPILGFVLALMQSSFLTRKRAMDVYAALPIRRERLMGAKVLAGITMMALPITVSYLIVMFANILLGGFHHYLIYEFFIVSGVSIVLVMIPYTLTVMLSTISGTVMENVLYPLVFLMGLPLIGYTIDLLCRYNIFGFASGTLFERLVGYLFPYALNNDARYMLLERGLTSTALYEQATSVAPDLTMRLGSFLVCMGFWLLACIGFIFLALSLVKRRKIEIAGVKGAGEILNTITCFIFSLAGGLLVLLLFSVEFMDQTLYRMRYVLFVAALLILFMVYQSTVLQSVRAVFKLWKRSAAGILAAVLFIVFYASNGFGIYNRIFDPDAIQSVTIDYTGINNSKNDISFFPSVNTYRKNESNHTVTLSGSESKYLLREFQEYTIDSLDKDTALDTVRIEYKMKNGFQASRQYPIVSTEAGRLLAMLMEQDEFIRKTSYAFLIDFNTYESIEIMDLFMTGNCKCKLNTSV